MFSAIGKLRHVVICREPASSKTFHGKRFSWKENWAEYSKNIFCTYTHVSNDLQYNNSYSHPVPLCDGTIIYTIINLDYL